MPDFETYQSPYTWRYASVEMRRLWSEGHKRRLWRRIWLALAEAQAEFGLVSAEQVADLRRSAARVDVGRALEIEGEIQHDLMAELQAYAEQCPLGGPILHLGATSMDIEDNADAIRVRQALDLLLAKLARLLIALAESTIRWAETPVIAFTHLQPAEPSTLGYRLAQYGQDLLFDWDALSSLKDRFRGKGMKGAVGTRASFGELLGPDRLEAFESRVMALLGLPYYPITTQTYPRKQEFQLVSALSGLGGSLHKLAFDLRVLQSPLIGELREPFGKKQVGSSAMPFKRNPIRAEKIDSLARFLAQLARLAWDNAAFSLLERTLDDSANRRTLLPEAFLAADELLEVAVDLVRGLEVDEEAMARNLDRFGSFAATERVLMALTKAGASRQEMHARLRDHALAAWRAVQAGEDNPLVGLVCRDPDFQRYLPEGQLERLMDAGDYVGDAPRRATSFAQSILDRFGSGPAA